LNLQLKLISQRYANIECAHSYNLPCRSPRHLEGIGGKRTLVGDAIDYCRNSELQESSSEVRNRPFLIGPRSDHRESKIWESFSFNSATIGNSFHCEQLFLSSPSLPQNDFTIPPQSLNFHSLLFATYISNFPPSNLHDSDLRVDALHVHELHVPLHCILPTKHPIVAALSTYSRTYSLCDALEHRKHVFINVWRSGHESTAWQKHLWSLYDRTEPADRRWII
jgi:hypothetical protein